MRRENYLIIFKLVADKFVGNNGMTHTEIDIWPGKQYENQPRYGKCFYQAMFFSLNVCFLFFSLFHFLSFLLPTRFFTSHGCFTYSLFL